MQFPEIPQDEAMRLQALHASGLLDTSPEERFDRLTRLAKQMFGVQMALVSLVDSTRQWFKSKQGLDACETGRDISFCGHAILGQDIFHIPDASLDPRFSDNPLVTGAPYIRFYAGAPLSTPEGLRIGTLCIIDAVPRKLSEQELRNLRDLADCVEAEINQVELHQQRYALQLAELQNQIIVRAQAKFINEPERGTAFDRLLVDILALTESEYGFIGEVLYTEQGQPYLKSYALTNIAWDKATREFYETNAPLGLEFTNLNTLFGAVMRSGDVVIANDPLHDPRRGGLPPGHPPLDAFLGIPIHHLGKLVGMIGVANRSGGYEQAMVDSMQPLLATLGQLIEAKRTHVKQRDTERRLADVIQGTHIGTWEWNVQTGAVIFNERWADIVGYTLAELEPVNIQTWLGLAHPEDLKISGEMLQKHFAGELDYYDIQCRMRHKAGHWVWVHDRGQVVSWTADGKPLLMSGTHADITERKNVELALHQFKSTLDGTLDCVFMFDPATMKFIYCNEGALRQVGYTREELLMMHPYDIKPFLTPEQFHEMIAPLLAGQQQAITFETLHRHKDGHDVPVEVFLQYVRETADHPCFVAIVRDISERKRIDRMKNEFVSTVSHELRTPLTSISGALGLIAGGAVGELPPKAREMVAIAHKNSQRLAFLINDLLDMEKLVAGKMVFDLQEQPLLPLLEQAIEANRAYGADRQVTLSMQAENAEAWVRVDGQRLLQVMANLLSNAIKYSKQGGIVEVRVQPKDGQVRVSVVDHGAGIPASFQPHMFRKFSQADSSDTRQRGGTGLGLAITRELLERMGGRIDFVSMEGQGSTFFFDLPLCSACC